MTDKRIIALAVTGLALVAGCSGGHGGAPAAKTAANAGTAASAGLGGGSTGGSVQTGLTASGGGATGGPGGAASSGSQGGAGGSSAGGGNSTAAPASPAPHPTATEVPLHAGLASACVTVGSTQTLTLHAEPEMRVIYDANYPDGKDGQVHGGFDSRGRTTADGTYTSTWTIAPGTPLGAADVELAAIGPNYHTGHQRLPFKVALTCP